MCAWLDYKKAYDSVSHEWIVESLRLAKLPENIIKAINDVMQLWAVKLKIQCEKENIETKEIKYLTGMLQGDTLSVIMFILCFNPLSHLLNKCDGYMMGTPGKRDTKITHLFFVDDLKLYSSNENKLKLQLDTITKFSNDIGMQFGEEKCAYICVENGKRKSLGNTIEINKVKIREIEEEETYKYLGIEETVQFNTALNKEKITKEYIKRLRKIWQSELNGFNKIIATNMFAVPVVTYSYGILNWTKANLQSLDIRTRKMLNMNNSLNRRGDVDRLYVTRKEGGRGLRNLEDEYIVRIVAMNEHLRKERGKNPYIEKVTSENNEKISKVAENIILELKIDKQQGQDDNKMIPKMVKMKLQNSRKTNWHQKPVHGYFEREKVENIDKKLSWAWLESGTLTSDVESYLTTIQEQEIYTKDRRKRNEKDTKKKNMLDDKCRMCKKDNETIQHILGCCPIISPNLYLNARHNPVAKVIYDEILQANNIENKEKQPIRVISSDDCDVWWDMKITMPSGVEHNKPDIVVWKKKEKLCQVIDISVPLDKNIDKKFQEKRNNYIPLISEMQRIYRDYKFEIIPVIIGALGTITNELKHSIANIDGISDKNKIIKHIQKKAMIGSLKITKTVMKMKE